MALNSTVALDLSDPEEAKVLGNPTEGALVLWLRDNGISYQQLRDDASVLEELPFSTSKVHQRLSTRFAKQQKTVRRRLISITNWPFIKSRPCVH